MRICVYGASSVKTDQKYITAVEQLGEILAGRGHSLVYGAGAGGLMGAVARGFTKGEGKILGVAPSFFSADGIIYDKCDELVRTVTMRERKQIMEDNSDAFVMVPGGVGTFDEFFEILTLRQLGRHCKPLAVYNLYGYYDKFVEFMQRAVDEYFVAPESLKLYGVFDNAEALVGYIEGHEGTISNINDTKYI